MIAYQNEVHSSWNLHPIIPRTGVWSYYTAHTRPSRIWICCVECLSVTYCACSGPCNSECLIIVGLFCQLCQYKWYSLDSGIGRNLIWFWLPALLTICLWNTWIFLLSNLMQSTDPFVNYYSIVCGKWICQGPCSLEMLEGLPHAAERSSTVGDPYCFKKTGL